MTDPSPYQLMGYPSFSCVDNTRIDLEKSIQKHGFIIITFDIKQINFDVHVVCKLEKTLKNSFELTLYRSCSENAKKRIYSSEVYENLIKMFKQKKT